MSIKNQHPLDSTRFSSDKSGQPSSQLSIEHSILKAIGKERYFKLLPKSVRADYTSYERRLFNEEERAI